MITQLDSLKIAEIRNIVGSHTVNYNTRKTTKFKSKDNKYNLFRVTRVDLTLDASKLTIVDCWGNSETVNLKFHVSEYTGLTERLLLNIVEKYIKTLCKNDSRFKMELLNVISTIRKNPSDYTKFDTR